LLGWGVIALLGMTHPSAIPYALSSPQSGLAIPLAVLTALPAVGRTMARLASAPARETTPPAALSTLAVPAIALAAQAPPLPSGLTSCSKAQDCARFSGRCASIRQSPRRSGGHGPLTAVSCSAATWCSSRRPFGDRVTSFRRLGARVVAVEPQPVLAKVLKLFLWMGAPTSR